MTTITVSGSSNKSNLVLDSNSATVSDSETSQVIDYAAIKLALKEALSEQTTVVVEETQTPSGVLNATLADSLGPLFNDHLYPGVTGVGSDGVERMYMSSGTGENASAPFLQPVGGSGLVCVDTSSNNVVWHRVAGSGKDTQQTAMGGPVYKYNIGPICSGQFTRNWYNVSSLNGNRFTIAGAAWFRGTPVIDKLHNLVWISTTDFATGVLCAFDMITGERKYEIDLFPERPQSVIGDIYVPGAAQTEALSYVVGNKWAPFGTSYAPLLSDYMKVSRSVFNIEYVGVNPVVYYGTMVGGEYFLKNLVYKDDLDEIGGYSSSGSVVKRIITDSSSSTFVWETKTNPVEIIPPGVSPVNDASLVPIPAECFRPGVDQMNINLNLIEGLPFIDSSSIGLHTSGTRKIHVHEFSGGTWTVRGKDALALLSPPIDVSLGDPVTSAQMSALTKTAIQLANELLPADASGTLMANIVWDASIEYSIDFPVDTSLNLDASYTGTNGTTTKTFTGAELVGPLVPRYEENGSLMIVNSVQMEKQYHTRMTAEVDTSYVLGANRPTVSQETDKHIAYSCNYYGASVWQQGLVIDENTVSVGTGNGNRSSVDEHEYLNGPNGPVTTMITALKELGENKITFEQFRALAVDQVYDQELSARGRRNLMNSIMTLDKITGQLYQYTKSVNYDSFSYAQVGGNGRWDLHGQPGNKPYAFVESIDGDMIAPVQMNNNILGSATKSGLAVFQPKSPQALPVPSITGDKACESGIKTYVEQSGTTRICIGYPGFLGGANYLVGTDRTRLYTGICNAAGKPPFEFDSIVRKPWKGVNGTDIPGGESYVSCCTPNGDIKWETTLGPASSSVHGIPVQVSPKEVFCGSYRSSVVQGFDLLTGKLTHTLKPPTNIPVDAGCLGPTYANDKIYAMYGRYSTNYGNEGDGNMYVFDLK